MASVRKSKRNVTGEKALGSGHSGGVPTMGGAPSVTGGQTSNWAKVVSRGKGGARSSPGVPCNADGNSEGLRTAAKTKEHSKRSKPDKYFAKQKLKKKEDIKNGLRGRPGPHVPVEGEAMLGKQLEILHHCLDNKASV